MTSSATISLRIPRILGTLLLSAVLLLTACDGLSSSNSDAASDRSKALEPALFPEALQSTWLRVEDTSSKGDHFRYYYDVLADRIDYWIWDANTGCYWTGRGDLLGREGGYFVIDNPGSFYHTRAERKTSTLKLSNYVKEGDLYRFEQDVFLSEAASLPAPLTEASRCSPPGSSKSAPGIALR